MTNYMETTVRNYLSAKKAADSSAEVLKSLEEELKGAMLSASLDKVEVDGKIVSLIQAERRSFDIETLKQLVSPAVFKQITEPTVKTQLFDAAFSLGKITSDVAESVTNKTPYSQLRVK